MAKVFSSTLCISAVHSLFLQYTRCFSTTQAISAVHSLFLSTLFPDVLTSELQWCVMCAWMLWLHYRRTRNFCGWKFSWFRDSMYYTSISWLLFLLLEVPAKVSLLSNSPTCALNRTRDRRQDGTRGTRKATHYIRRSQSTSRWTCWPCATCWKLDV